MKIHFTSSKTSSSPKTVPEKIGDSILEHAEIHEVDLDHSCGGNCACCTCHVWVTAGMEFLSPPQEDELALLETANDRQENSRLACQAKVMKTGEISVTIPV